MKTTFQRIKGLEVSSRIMRQILQVLATITALVSFGVHAEVITSKGGPQFPLPAECENASGHTYGTTRLKSYGLPQLNGTDLLACVDQKSPKRYFRLRLAILVKKADGVLQSQVADEVIIPWQPGVYPETLTVANPNECVFTEDANLPTELGPYALGIWQQQTDESLLLGDIIIAWKIDELSKTIKVVSSRNLLCSSPGGD